MATSVKDLLKHDLPPTYQDAQMRRKHTLGSVEHNIKHFSDHGKGVCDALQKLHTVDSAKSHSEAKRVLHELEVVRKEVEKCLHGKGC